MKAAFVLPIAGALLLPVSKANAADSIIVAEPEPIEYLQVCDVFGDGYFFIPGSLTCLSFSGHMRYDIGFGDALGRDASGIDVNGDGDTSWRKRARLQFRSDIRTMTEFGVLRAFSEVRTQYDVDTNEPTRQGLTEVILREGFIEFAGFRIGKSVSFFRSFAGNAGQVITHDIIRFGSENVNLFAYTHDFDNGLSATLSLEDNMDGSIAGDFEAQPYIPNIASGLRYDGDDFALTFIGGYDSAAEQGAFKARLDARLGRFASFAMAAVSTDGNFENFYANWNGDWALWGGLATPITEKISYANQLSYDESSTFAFVNDIKLELVPGLQITGEIAYTRNFDNDGDTDQWGGLVRFQRQF